MFKYISFAAIINSLIVTAAMATSTPAAGVVINQVQTGTAASASQEFIELYNSGDTDTSLSGWTIEYKATTSVDTASNWSKKATLSGVIKAGGFYLVAPTSYLATADASWSAGLASTGGNIRLRDSAGNVVDQLGYGATANAAESQPASAPAAGQSLERDEGLDTNNNAADFEIQATPTPRNSTYVAPVIAPAVEPSDNPEATAGQGGADVPASPPSYLPVQITELLVNPMSPLTDSQDEFIELYNPNDQPVDVAGYTLRAGTSFRDSYTLPDETINPGGYLAVYSRDSHLSLVNTGGAAEVLDPSGVVIDQTPSYGPAPEGQSWAEFDNGWQWTLQTTPGQPNIFAAPVISSVLKTSTKTVAKPKVATARKTSTKAASAKSKSPKPKSTKPKSKTLTAAAMGDPAKGFMLDLWLILPLAALTMGYAAYEFRYDLQNLYYKLRRNPKTGDKAGAVAARR